MGSVHGEPAKRAGRLLPGVKVVIREEGIRRALEEVLARLPVEALDIPTLNSITSRKTSDAGSLAGLTRRVTYERTIRFGLGKTRTDEVVVQKVELYRDMMMQLSLSSREAVIAHELAHAWLNDNIAPDDSATREEECDALAEKWGFVDELRALADETE